MMLRRGLSTFATKEGVWHPTSVSSLNSLEAQVLLGGSVQVSRGDQLQGMFYTMVYRKQSFLCIPLLASFNSLCQASIQCPPFHHTPAATVTTVTINATSATAISYTNTTTAKTSSTCPPSKRGRVCGIHVKGALLQRCN